MDTTNTGRASKSFGIWSAVLGLVSVAGVAFVWLTSTIPFTPGNAIVAAAALIMVLSWLASVALGLVSLRSAGRGWAIVGLALAALSIAGMVVLLNTAG